MSAPLLFWDASALAKCYITEIGSNTVDALFAMTPSLPMVGAMIGYNETALPPKCNSTEELQQRKRTDMHQFETEETEKYASKYRVTPEELTEAVTRIEMRHAEEQEAFANTLTLGEAIEQLHLNMTPEELLAEVELSRQSDETIETADEEIVTEETLPVSSMQMRHAGREVLRNAVLALSLGLNVMLLCANSNFSNQPHDFGRMSYVPPTVNNLPATSTPTTSPVSPPVSTSSAISSYWQFWKMPDGQIFEMSASGIISVAHQDFHVTVYPCAPRSLQTDDYFWPVQKRNGKTWVVGYVSKEVSENTLKQGAFTLNNASVLNKIDLNEYKWAKIPIERFKSITEPPIRTNNGYIADKQIWQIPASK